MPVKAVVFDMDGVLIDAKEWHYEALNSALELFGYKISRDQHLGRFDGLPTHIKLKILTEETSLPRSLHSFINRMKQTYTQQILHARLIPNPTHQATLQHLKDRGYKIGLASNSVRSTIIAMMEKAGLIGFMDFILSNEDVSNPKPSPQIYLKAMHLAGVTGGECLVLEDNPFGWRAALGAGAHLLKIDTVADVNICNIDSKIKEIDKLVHIHDAMRRAA